MGPQKSLVMRANNQHLRPVEGVAIDVQTKASPSAADTALVNRLIAMTSDRMFFGALV